MTFHKPLGLSHLLSPKKVIQLSRTLAQAMIGLGVKVYVMYVRYTHKEEI